MDGLLLFDHIGSDRWAREKSRADRDSLACEGNTVMLVESEKQQSGNP